MEHCDYRMMRNVGLVEWGNDVELVYTKGHRELSLCERYPVINALPGQEVEVSVTLKTPATAGRVCAYFRLKKKDKFFGPRVWADIIVAVAGGDFQENVCRVDDDKLISKKIQWKKVVSCK